MYIFENTDNAQHRRRINSLAQSFVIKADVAPGNGDFQFLTSFGDPVNHLRELPHDVRLLRVSEVQAIGRPDRRRARTGHVARGFGHSVHGSQPRIQIAPAAVAVECHRQASSLLRSLNPDHAGIARARAFDGVGLHHMIVLLPDPTLAANIRACQQTLQVAGKIPAAAQLDVLWHFPRHRWFPAFQRTLVHRCVVGQSMIGNFGDNLPMLKNAHLAVTGNPSHFHRVETPLLEDTENFFLTSFLRNQQHAFLRLAEHDLVWSHARLALRHASHLNLDSHVATCSHLAGRTGQPGRTHVLNANDGAGLHGFEACLQQKFFEEWISDLNVGPLCFRRFAEFFAGHGGAVDAISASLCPDVNHRIAFARSLGVEDLVPPDQAESKGIHQGITGIARFKFGLSAEVRHTKTVSIRGDATDHPFEQRMILLDLLRGHSRPRLSGRAQLGSIRDWSKPQRIHYRYRPCAHGENIAQDSAHACRRALKWLDERRMVVRFNLERARPSFADVDDAGVFTGALHHAAAARG